MRWLLTALKQIYYAAFASRKKKRRDKWENLPIDIVREAEDWWRVIRRKR